MQTNREALFDTWWGRIVGGFSLIFLGWFLLDNWTGVVSLAELLGSAITAIPGSIETVWNYYGDVSGDSLLRSMLVGAGFGAVSSVVIFLTGREWITLPTIALPGFVAGVLAGIIAFNLLENIWLALLIAFVVMLIVGYFTEYEVRAFFQRETIQRISHPQALRWIGFGIIAGGIAGALGSQLLAYPMQHCTYTPEIDNTQRQAGYVVTAISALIFLIPTWTFMLHGRDRSGETQSGFFKGWIIPLAFLLPTVVSLLVFLYYPAVQVATLSLVARRLRQERFTCLGNYVTLFDDPIYQNSFVVTLTLTVIIVFLSMALALGIALLASQKVKFASVYRTLLIWPYALSPVVVGVIFLSMFRQGRTGLINYGLFELFNITPDWLTDARLAPWVVVFASVYNILGFNILFYVAGLQNVPKDLLEAGQIDGANVFQRFIRITFPMLSPYTFFLLVTNVTYAFYGVYGAVDTLTEGGPPLGLAGANGGATDVLIYKLYSDAFSPAGQVGLAAAQSIVLFMLVAVITVLQFYFVERRVTYSN